MKKVKLFSFALAALMLGACSSEDVIDNGGQTVLPGEKGYISLGINLPTTPSSRALNDQFDKGDPSEYAVNDATLLIFSGTDEANATFSGAYDLGTITAGSAVDGNITTSFRVTKAITKPGSGNVYAMVIVNDNGLLTGDNTNGWKLAGTSLTGKKFSEVNDIKLTSSADAAVDASAFTHDGFFMTNAPLYTGEGGTTVPSGNVTTLTEIDANNIFSTEAEANANPAANIYVERAVAKVSVTPASGNSYTTNTQAGTAEITGWALDVTNKSTYVVRNTVDADWWGLTADNTYYRFVGQIPVAAGLYRTYWAYDPNYTAWGGDFTNNFNYLKGTISEPTLLGTDQNGYCLENTFDVANQNQNQTTRVIVAAKLNGGADFYVVNNAKGTIYDRAGMEDVIAAEYISNPTVREALKSLASGKTLDKSKLTITFDKGETGGDMKLTEITINDNTIFEGGNIPEVLTKDGNNDIIDAINDAKKVSYYKDGIAYYPVMIQHFGQELTPWDAATVGGTSYPDNNASKWLGRYGVLRNNWYDISVTSINSIGSAEVPTVTGTPDDPVESWISVKINVLSWAKRTQNVDL